VVTARRRFGLDVSPLRSRDFRLLFIGGGITSIGSFITEVTIPFQVARLTHSPVMVGLLGVCELVPLLFMSFVGGALADYLDRRRLVIGGELAFAVLTGTLLLNALLGQPQLWLLFVIAALTTTVVSVQRPALDALIPRLVEPARIPAANALNSARTNAAMLAGPALAGVLIASVGIGWAYAIDLVTFGVSLMCLAGMRAVPPPAAPDRPSLRSVATGVRYAFSRQELLGTYLIDINAMFFGMPQALYPFVALELGGPAVLGLLYAVPSLGALLATLTSGWSGRVHRHGLAVAVAAAGWGVSIAGFGLAVAYADRLGVAGALTLSLLGLAAAGAADMISGVFRSTIWDQTIPDHLRGRLAGIEMISYSAGPTLGNLESGLATRLVGLGGSILWGGVLGVAGTLALSAVLPKFLRYDGRDGLQHKQAADAHWEATAHERLGRPVPIE
jgi:MFS family permease